MANRAVEAQPWFPEPWLAEGSEQRSIKPYVACKKVLPW